MKKFLALGLLGIAVNTGDVQTTLPESYARNYQVQGEQQQRPTSGQTIQGNFQPRNFGGSNIDQTTQFGQVPNQENIGNGFLGSSRGQQAQQGAQEWQRQPQRQGFEGQNPNLASENAGTLPQRQWVEGQQPNISGSQGRFQGNLGQGIQQGQNQLESQQGHFRQGAEQGQTRERIPQGNFTQGQNRESHQQEWTERQIPQRVSSEQEREQFATQRQQNIQAQDARISSQVRLQAPQGSVQPNIAY